jgi:Ala-tRNA(Pro) deacylase
MEMREAAMISSSLQSYLEAQAIAFDEVPHAPALCASDNAQAAHISGNSLAKGVVLKSGDSYMMAVVPASRRVRLDALGNMLGREVALASESEIRPLFADCEIGAVPPVGAAYGLDMIVDDSLMGDGDVYFEGGDHRTLVHLNADGWRQMTRNARHSSFSG